MKNVRVLQGNEEDKPKENGQADASEEHGKPGENASGLVPVNKVSKVRTTVHSCSEPVRRVFRRGTDNGALLGRHVLRHWRSTSKVSRMSVQFSLSFSSGGRTGPRLSIFSPTLPVQALKSTRLFRHADFSCNEPIFSFLPIHIHYNSNLIILFYLRAEGTLLYYYLRNLPLRRGPPSSGRYPHVH